MKEYDAETQAQACMQVVRSVKSSQECLTAFSTALEIAGDQVIVRAEVLFEFAVWLTLHQAKSDDVRDQLMVFLSLSLSLCQLLCPTITKTPPRAFLTVSWKKKKQTLLTRRGVRSRVLVLRVLAVCAVVAAVALRPLVELRSHTPTFTHSHSPSLFLTHGL